MFGYAFSEPALRPLGARELLSSLRILLTQSTFTVLTTTSGIVVLALIQAG